MRLRKLAIDGEKTLQWAAELAYQQNVQESRGRAEVEIHHEEASSGAPALV